MKKRLMALAAYALLLSVFTAPFAVQAQTKESITSFMVQAELDTSRMLQVTEQITYDFGRNRKHGIYRDIPVRYLRNGGWYNVRLDVTGVLMDNQSVPYRVEQEGDSLRIKIGDADVTITGAHTYAITYRTNRAINFFDGEAELYWNVTGNNWDVPVAKASFALTGPAGVDATALRTACFVGVTGSTEANCAIAADGRTVTVRAPRNFTRREGMTVAIRFPAGAIDPPTLLDRAGQFIVDNWSIGIPVVVFMVMLWLWHTRGRDPQGRGTIVPQYEPPRGLFPAAMVALQEQDVPDRAVTATILDLARRGYLTIEFGEEKKLLGTQQRYTFQKRKEPDDALASAEREIYDGLFDVSNTVELKELVGRFGKHMDLFKSFVFSALKRQNLFEENPKQVRGWYIGAAVAMVVAVFWFVGSLVSTVTSVAIILSAGIIAGMGWFMPRVTPEGAVALEEVQGFRWFLSVTEKDRLAFHNAPTLKPEQFHAFLPAAVALGVEDQWAKQFAGLNVPPPSYATGSVLHHWLALNFVHDIGRMNSAAASTAYRAPSSAGSGGSGFSGGGSGGGFGGGGGGSW
jgi:uncharacterized membrane protein